MHALLRTFARRSEIESVTSKELVSYRANCRANSTLGLRVSGFWLTASLAVLVALPTACLTNGRIDSGSQQSIEVGSNSAISDFLRWRTNVSSRESETARATPPVTRNVVRSPSGSGVRATLATNSMDRSHVLDDSSSVGVSWVVRGVKSIEVQKLNDFSVYPGALGPGSHIVTQRGIRSVEDWLYLDSQGAGTTVTYDLTFTKEVYALRSVEGTLEVVDSQGVPRLRVLRPWLVDSNGTRHHADLSVVDCEVDVDPRGPWHRALAKLNRRDCEMRVSWAADVRYPIWVDPSWTTTETLAHDRGHHTATVLNDGFGTVLVAGGTNESPNLDSAELYDPDSGTWAATGSMNNGRSGHTASLLQNDRVLVVGADDSDGTTAEEYNVGTGMWTTVASLAAGRKNHSATVLNNGRVLIAGGFSGGPIASSEAYNPATGTWSTVAALQQARYYHTATLLGNGKVLVAGGSSPTSLATAELFDPATNSWAPTGSLSGARSFHAATHLQNGEVLVHGGLNLATLATSEIYNPALGTWSTTGAMNQARQLHKSVLLDDGSVLAVAGYRSGIIDSVERYSPSTQTWSETVSIPFARTGHTATLLGNSTVLVAGGTQGGFNALWDCEIFDPTLAAAGEACLFATDCQSGQCVDGVCCSTVCDGGCQVCAVGSGATSDGTCTTLPIGSVGPCSPFLCAGQGTCPSSCAGDSWCDIGNYCASGGACMAQKAVGQACDSSATGDCFEDDCAVCQSGHCAAGECRACITDSECLSGEYCSAVGNCEQQKSQGTSCDDSVGGDCFEQGCAVCDTGHCSSGYCCNSQCDGACESCSITGGASINGVCVSVSVGSSGQPTCSPYLCNGTSGLCPTACDSVSDCAAGAMCSDQGCTFSSSLGEACTNATECDSGNCADGVCCNDTCTGQCEACAEPGIEGTCVPVMGSPRGTRVPCVGTGDECEGVCDGAVTVSCAYPAQGTNCGDPSCSGDVLSPAGQCDGAGVCQAGSSITCNPYTCDDVQNECRTNCITDSDCAQGASCVTQLGTCAVMTASCYDGFTVQQANGQRVSCSPYSCVGGVCQQQCTKDSECVEGYVCEANECVVDTSTGGRAGASGAAAGGSGGSGAQSSAGNAGSAGTSGGAEPATTADEGGCRVCVPGNGSSADYSLRWKACFAVVASILWKRKKQRRTQGSRL